RVDDTAEVLPCLGHHMTVEERDVLAEQAVETVVDVDEGFADPDRDRVIEGSGAHVGGADRPQHQGLVRLAESIRGGSGGGGAAPYAATPRHPLTAGAQRAGPQHPRSERVHQAPSRDGHAPPFPSPPPRAASCAQSLPWPPS